MSKPFTDIHDRFDCPYQWQTYSDADPRKKGCKCWLRPEEMPYLTKTVVIDRQFNPEYGIDRVCVCGHTYERHFDWDPYEDEPVAVGCKYDECYTFVEDEDA